MTDATVSRIGQINQANDTRALFLKVFAGEILTTFDETNVMMDKHVVRTIANGKSAQFPVTGVFKAKYHKVGEEILGTKSNHNERVITIDDLLIADSFIANIDEAMTHYDVRSEYSRKMGEALAVECDRTILRVVVQASNESTPIVTGVPTKVGGKIVSANAKTSADDLIKAIFNCAKTFDEKNVPASERFVFVAPAEYYLLAQNTTIMNRDWGGIGFYADAEVIRVAGISVVKTNHLPSTVAQTLKPLTEADKYKLDATTGLKVDPTKLVAIAMQREAVGTVKLLDLAMESEYDIRRQGTLSVAKYLMGHGVLRSECAISIVTA